MRLSNNQKLLLQFFLITFLTLLLKPNANAQAVQSTVFAYNDFRHNRDEDERIYIGANVEKHDEETTEAEVLPTINFHRESVYLKPLLYRMMKNNKKVYLAQARTPVVAYSIDVNHSARLTFKLFKLVIVPLWQSK